MVMIKPDESEHFDVFVACSFSGKIDYETGEVTPEYRAYVEGVLGTLREHGLTAFCAIEREGWRIGEEPPEVGVEADLAAIRVSVSLLALVGKITSDGVSFEMGFAHALEKPVYLLKEPDVEDLSYWKQGLVGNSDVKVIESVDEMRRIA